MDQAIGILSPVDGDMLCERDGTVSGGCLLVLFRVAAPAGRAIEIGGVAAEYSDGAYTAAVPLCQYRNTVIARDTTTGCTASVTVFRLSGFAGKYRLSLDDNIWFLQDLAQNAGHYKSLFDNPYLGFFKQIHDAFGTKVHINIYNQCPGFDLTEMPDTYKSQWRDHADWLRLSFHALADQPDSPYRDAAYETVRRDCERVMEQIVRFAGGEVTGPVTTLHWGEATVDGCRALRYCGYTCQVGDFNVDNGLSPVSYYLDVEQRRHINRRSIWADTAEGIVFFRSAIILDCHRQEAIVPFLDEFRSDPHRSAFVDLLIHEQYFYPHYAGYQPDYCQKVLTAVRWAADHGYKPAFLSDCVF